VAADLVLRARRVVAGGAEVPASVVVADGRIVAVDTFDAPVASGVRVVTLAEDEVLLPGLVDTHVHVNEPGRTEWEGFASATRAAAAGGVTTLVDMPLNSIPPTTSVAALAEKQAAATGRTWVDVAFWGGAVPGNGPDLAALHEAGVVGFKAFLVDSGVPEFGHLDDAGLRVALAQTARLGSLLLLHAEDPGTLDAAPAADGRGYPGFLASRPREAEERAIERVVATLRDTGGRAHIVHLSDADAVPIVAAAQAEGLALTAETCPHYLTLCADEIPDGATEFKCCPPIRERDNQDGLWAGLAGGTLAAVVSDHSPSTPDLKRLDTGDFAQAWGGIAGLELGLPLVWTAARGRGHTLVDVVGWMGTGPADLVGFTDRGRIAVGAAAHLVAFAPDEAFTVDVTALHHRNPVSPYAGRALTGVVRRTWLYGTPVDLDADPHGRLLRRGIS
jgi:allantoinase